MGCDIHLRIEQKRKTETDDWRLCKLTREKSWGDRVYGMFARLANVRNYWELKHLPVRGFPKDAASVTCLAYYCIVLPDEEYEKGISVYENSKVHYVKESTANRWISGGVSEEVKCDQLYTDKRIITHPDWHSASWCTVEEMRKCVNETFYKDGRWTGDYIEWLSLLGAMDGIEKSGEYDCRAVFWFDN